MEETYNHAKTERDVVTEEFNALKLKSEKIIRELRAEISQVEDYDAAHYTGAKKANIKVLVKEIVY